MIDYKIILNKQLRTIELYKDWSFITNLVSAETLGTTDLKKLAQIQIGFENAFQYGYEKGADDLRLKFKQLMKVVDLEVKND